MFVQNVVICASKYDNPLPLVRKKWSSSGLADVVAALVDSPGEV